MPDGNDQRERVAAKAASCACGNLRKASRAITKLYDEALRPSGLRITQFGILGTTMMMGPVTVTRLAEETVTDRTTLTRNLKLLTDKGLIRMETGEDQREREVTLTEQGRKALADAYPLWKKAQAQIVNGLGEEQWNALREGLSSILSLAQ